MQRCICGSSARFSNARLLLPQQCYFFKSNAVFTQAVLLFEIPSKLLLPQQRCFFKFNAAFAAAVLIFQIQDCFYRSSVALSDSTLLLRNSTLQTPQQRCFCKFSHAAGSPDSD